MRFFAVVLFSLFFIFFCEIINGAENKNNGDVNRCNMQEFFNVTQTKKLVQLRKSYYRFDLARNIYADDDYLTFWLQVDPQNTLLNLELSPIGNLLPTGKIFFEPYGNENCLQSIDITEIPFRKSIDLSTCECQPFEQNNEKYVPFKVWTKNGPIKLEVIQDISLMVFVFKEEKQKMSDQKCLDKRLLQRNYAGFDYTDLLAIPEVNENNGTELIEEMNQTVSFFNDNGTDYVNLVNSVTVVWLKVKDSAPEHYLLVETENDEMIQKTFEIGLEANGRESPQKEVEFLSNGLKVTFLKELCIPDYKFFGYVRYILTVNETGVLKASFWDKKSGENLKLYFLGEEANGIPKVASNETNFGKILLPLTTTTTSTTTTSTTAASTSTTPKPTPSEPDTKNELPKETGKPAAHGKGEGETAEASGLSLWILIPIIIISIIGLLLLVGLMIYCVLRYLRRQKQKKLPPQTPINPKPAIPTPKTGSKTESADNNIVQIVPPPIQPSTAALTSASISKPEIAPSTAPAASAEPLALEKTQSVKNPSSIFNEFSVTRREAKYAKRDPRFPELVPGTIEYMVVKGQLDAKSPKTGEFVRSGTVDDSNDAQYVNP